MLEIIEDGTASKKSLFLNGKKLEKVEVNSYPIVKSDAHYFHIKVYEYDNAELLSNQKLSDFPDKITLKFRNWLDLSIFNLEVGIDTMAPSFSKPKITENAVVVVKLIPKLETWNFPYSFTDYSAIFENEWREISVSNISNIDWMKESKNIGMLVNSLEFDSSLKKTFPIDVSQETIYDIVSPFVEMFLDCHDKAIKNLNSNEKFSLSLLFNFPEELKPYCEQYLLYLAKFLKDVGINITQDLKEEAGKVLFSVTPTDDVEALNKIREAITVYLNLPASPISDLAYSENFALMRLQQQVRNLQHSQQMAKTEILSAQYALGLAQQNIDNQDRMIVRQNSLIENQTKIIEKITSKSIMMDSVENKEEFEKVFDGLEFGESEELKKHLGIKFNPIKSLKSLGEKFTGKDFEITSLNLNEEANNKDD